MPIIASDCIFRKHPKIKHLKQNIELINQEVFNAAFIYKFIFFIYIEHPINNYNRNDKNVVTIQSLHCKIITYAVNAVF